jgi:hypothetical protein
VGASDGGAVQYACSRRGRCARKGRAGAPCAMVPLAPWCKLTQRAPQALRGTGGHGGAHGEVLHRRTTGNEGRWYSWAHTTGDPVRLTPTTHPLQSLHSPATSAADERCAFARLRAERRARGLCGRRGSCGCSVLHACSTQVCPSREEGFRADMPDQRARCRRRSAGPALGRGETTVLQDFGLCPRPVLTGGGHGV